jgi:hypothetical protein
VSVGKAAKGFWAGVLFLGMITGLVGIFWLMLPRSAPAYQEPSFASLIIDNRWFVAGARCVLLVGGVYIVVSAIALMGKKQWLRGFGPLSAPPQEVAEDVRALRDERDGLRDDLLDARNTIGALHDQLVSVLELTLSDPGDDRMDVEGGGNHD